MTDTSVTERVHVESHLTPYGVVTKLELHNGHGDLYVSVNTPGPMTREEIMERFAKMRVMLATGDFSL